MLRKAVKHIIEVGRKPVGHAKIAGKRPTKTARDTYDCHVTQTITCYLSLSKKVSKPHAPYGHPQ